MTIPRQNRASALLQIPSVAAGMWDAVVFTSLQVPLPWPPVPHVHFTFVSLFYISVWGTHGKEAQLPAVRTSPSFKDLISGHTRL